MGLKILFLYFYVSQIEAKAPPTLRFVAFIGVIIKHITNSIFKSPW